MNQGQLDLRYSHSYALHETHSAAPCTWFAHSTKEICEYHFALVTRQSAAA